MEEIVIKVIFSQIFNAYFWGKNKFMKKFIRSILLAHKHNNTFAISK